MPDYLPKHNRPFEQAAIGRFKADKQLGQHFLIDASMIERIVEVIKPSPETAFVEIGPGLGALTLPVLEQTKRLTAIEFDKRVIPILQQKARAIAGELTIVECDALSVDYGKLLGNANYKVFGNLPYQISTPIIFALSGLSCVEEMVFMLQKEVVARMAALPDERHYGRLSVMLQYRYEVSALFDVPPSSFSPPPKVMSAMVLLQRLVRPRWQVTSIAMFEKVVKQAFSMRRKTLRNALKPMISADEMAALGINAQLRPENIDGSAYVAISNYLTTTIRG